MVAPARTAHEDPELDRASQVALSSLCAAFRFRVEQDFPGASAGTYGEGWQRKLADRIDVSQFVISTLWKGNPRNLRLKTLLKLRAYIGRPIDEILGLNSQGFREPLPSPSAAE